MNEPRQITGLIEAAEVGLTEALEEHYPAPVLRQLDPEAEGASEIATKRTTTDALEALFAHNVMVTAALAALTESEGRGRGEQIRRSAILAGLGDIEPGLRKLVSDGLVVMVPAPGQRDVNLHEEIESRRYLQRELLLPDPVGALLTTYRPEAPAQKDASLDERDVVPASGISLATLELNLLHVAFELQRGALLINKDGTPNRRALARFVQGLVLPTMASSGDADLNRPEVFEPVTFLLALAMAIPLCRLDGREIVADNQGMADYFLADRRQRHRLLVRAYRACDNWREVETARVLVGGELYLDLNISRRGVLASEQNNGKGPLGGARGQILSDLHKLPVDKWVSVEDVTELLIALDRGYLAKSLGKGSAGAAPRQFINAVLTVALPWLGVAECGQWVGSTGSSLQVFRTTSRGDLLLRDEEPEQQSERPPALFVQPNFEVTVFLDDAPMTVLYGLYRVGERASLADRIAVFKLTAESVQRGLGSGLSAEEIISFLQGHARAPLPQTVEFAIGDWERVQRRIALYASGTLITYPDPDAFDTVAGNIEHTWRGSDDPVRVGASALFLPDAVPTDVERIIDLDAAHVVDYDGEPPRCLQHDGQLDFSPLPCGLDMVTQHEMSLLCAREANTYELSADKIAARWPEDTARHLLAFLEPRLAEGLLPELELQLLATLDREVHADLVTEATVVLTSSAMVCDALLEIPGIEEMIEQRLGDNALLVKTKGVDSVREALSQLGLFDG